jgi:hypothetical protein
MMVEIWPVIHALDLNQVLRCADVAATAKCPGVFLISMHGDDDSLDVFAPHVADLFPSLKLGVNYLGLSAPDALIRSQFRNYAATWTDHQEFTRGKLSDDARGIINVIRPGHLLFAAVAFKGQAPDPLFPDSARLAAHFGLIPTTSGIGTGVAPDLEKLHLLRRTLHPADPLAVASGITPENISLFAPHLTHVLVATGISKSFHEFDAEKLARLMRSAA